MKGYKKMYLLKKILANNDSQLATTPGARLTRRNSEYPSRTRSNSYTPSISPLRNTQDPTVITYSHWKSHLPTKQAKQLTRMESTLDPGFFTAEHIQILLPGIHSPIYPSDHQVTLSVSGTATEIECIVHGLLAFHAHETGSIATLPTATIASLPEPTPQPQPYKLTLRIPVDHKPKKHLEYPTTVPSIGIKQSPVLEGTELNDLKTAVFQWLKTNNLVKTNSDPEVQQAINRATLAKVNEFIDLCNFTFRANDYEGLLACAKFTTTIYFWDDSIDKDPDIGEKTDILRAITDYFLAIFDEKEHEALAPLKDAFLTICRKRGEAKFEQLGENLGNCFIDFIQNLRTYCKGERDHLIRFFIAGAKNYLNAMLLQAHHQKDETPHISLATLDRGDESGAPPVERLSLCVSDIEIPEKLFDTPSAVAQLLESERLSTLIIIMENDKTSARKEWSEPSAENHVKLVIGRWEYETTLLKDLLTIFNSTEFSSGDSYEAVFDLINKHDRRNATSLRINLEPFRDEESFLKTTLVYLRAYFPDSVLEKLSLLETLTIDNLEIAINDHYSLLGSTPPPHFSQLIHALQENKQNLFTTKEDPEVKKIVIGHIWLSLISCQKSARDELSLLSSHLSTNKRALITKALAHITATNLEVLRSQLSNILTENPPDILSEIEKELDRHPDFVQEAVNYTVTTQTELTERYIQFINQIRLDAQTDPIATAVLQIVETDAIWAEGYTLYDHTLGQEVGRRYSQHGT
jgi:hypothetical protein